MSNIFTERIIDNWAEDVDLSIEENLFWTGIHVRSLAKALPLLELICHDTEWTGFVYKPCVALCRRKLIKNNWQFIEIRFYHEIPFYRLIRVLTSIDLPKTQSHETKDTDNADEVLDIIKKWLKDETI